MRLVCHADKPLPGELVERGLDRGHWQLHLDEVTDKVVHIISLAVPSPRRIGQRSRLLQDKEAHFKSKGWKDSGMASRPDRKDQLLESALILASDLSLPVVLQRIIELAVKLTDARYGALGVLGSDGRLRDFLTTGLTPEQRQAIGPPPVARGSWASSSGMPSPCVCSASRTIRATSASHLTTRRWGRFWA